MIEKARKAAAFLFWYCQTSLPEVKFAIILHAWTKLSSSLCKHVFCFSTFILFIYFFSLFRYPMYFDLMSQFLVH